METKETGKVDEGAEVLNSKDPEVLANALRFEREKTKTLVAEVVALEDELVNRSMEEFDAVVTDDTREFWREQLLKNRAAATVALQEMAQAKAGAGKGAAADDKQVRRPLHNRAAARPAIGGQADRGAAGAGAADKDAARIRNRAHEIAKAEQLPFSVAFRRAEGELSEK